MKFLLTLVVLAASVAAADTKVPKPPPALPQVEPSPTQQYQLSFSAQPAEVPDIASWVPAQGEAVITHTNVVEGVAKGTDHILSALVARKICDPTVNRCSFLTRFSLNDEAPADPNSRVAIRYTIRSSSGVLIEGFTYTPTRDHKDYRFWRRVDGAWAEEAAPPGRTAEMQLVGELMQLVMALEKSGDFNLTN